MKKIAIVILSDPNNGDESLGRLFNALVLANDLNSSDKDVLVFFQGAGSRWIKTLEDLTHPAHILYKNIKPQIKGVSMACATVFGAIDDVKAAKMNLLSEYNIPGLGWATSLATYLSEGYVIITF